MEAFHPVIYLFGAVLLYAAVRMVRGGQHVRPEDNRVLRAVRRILPATEDLRGQRFVIREGGRLLATPLLVTLIVVEVTDLIFAVDSIPAILAVTTDTFLVYTSNVCALLGMRALYFLLAGAAARFRYLRPGLAIILGAVAVKLLTADLFEVPVWASPALIAAVLAAVAILSIRDRRPGAWTAGPRDRSPVPSRPVPVSTGGRPAPAQEAGSRSPGSGRGPGSSGRPRRATGG